MERLSYADKVITVIVMFAFAKLKTASLMVLQYVPLVCVLVLAAYLRFHNLAYYGFHDNDTVHYSDLAFSWYNHDYISPYSKPGYHLIGSITIPLLGYYDYNLPYLASFLDVLIALMIFIIGRKIGLSILLATTAALVYALLPQAIHQCMLSLAHVPSSFFVILSFCFLLFSVYSESWTKMPAFAFMAGALIVYGAFVHPSVLGFIPIYLFALVAGYFAKNIRKIGEIREKWKVLALPLIVQLAFFCAGIALVIGVFSFLMFTDRGASANTIMAAIGNIPKHIQNWFGYKQLAVIGYKCNSLADCLSFLKRSSDDYFIPMQLVRFFAWSFVSIVLLGGVAFLVSGMRKAGKSPAGFRGVSFAGLIMVLLVALFFPVVFYVAGTPIDGRFFVPLVPFMVLAGACVFERCAGFGVDNPRPCAFYLIAAVSTMTVALNYAMDIVLGWKMSLAIIFILSAIIIFFRQRLARSDATRHFVVAVFCMFILVLSYLFLTRSGLGKLAIEKTPTNHRQIANVLMDRVNKDNRLLIGPYFFLRNIYFEAKYINKDWIYRLKTSWKPEITMLKKFKIRYVVIARFWTDRYHKEGTTEPWSSYNTIQVTEEKEKEAFSRMEDGMNGMGAKVLFKNAAMTIYELPYETADGESAAQPDEKNPVFSIVKDVARWRHLVSIRRKEQ